MTSPLAIADPWSPTNELVTGATPGIGKALAGFGDELPVVAGGMQAQLQDAEGLIVAHLGRRRQGLRKRSEVGAAGADHELADASPRVSGAGGIERGVALVVMRVPGKNDLRPRLIQRLPQRLHLRGVAATTANVEAEARMVPIGQRTGSGMGGQVGAQPLPLGRTCPTPAGLAAVAVEHHDVPAPQVIAIVAPAGAAAVGVQRRGRRPEVAKVAGGSRGQVIVVAHGGTGAALVPAPARIVALGNLLGRTGLVGKVPQGSHGARSPIEER